MSQLDQETTFSRIKQRRLDRMRLGQSVCEIFPLLSDPEVRVGVVPLTEAEYRQAEIAALALNVPSTAGGLAVIDREEKLEVLYRCLREIDDPSKRIFSSVDQMIEVLEPPDINFLYDNYVEIQNSNSPSLVALSEEEINFLRQTLDTIPLNDLSGRQLYALSRFLGTLSETQLMGRLPGSFLTP